MDAFQSSFVGPGTPNPFNAQVSTGLAVMAHEIGHVLGLAHAPCGGAAGPDPAYPYAGGQLGARTLYDSSYVDGEIGALASPRVGGVMATDLMGYCSGVQISDFNYALARQFAEAHTAAFPVAAAGPGVSAAAVRTAVEAPALLAVAGQILAEGVHLQPLAATTVRRVLPTPSRATWLLRLTTAAGETIDVPFQPLALSHGEAVSFFVTVPMPASAVTDVQVLRSGVALPKVARVS
jgi:hypothetical protein